MAKWVQAHAPHCDNGFERYVAVGCEIDGKLIAGWVYSDFRGHSISISIASIDKRWCSRKSLRSIFGYPFLQLKCERLMAVTGASQSNVRRLLEWAGFTHEGTLRRGFADDDAVIYGMLKEECHWHGQRRRRINPNSGPD